MVSQLKTAEVVEKTPSLTEILTQEEIDLLHNPETERARQYVLEHLNEDERKIITTGDGDEVIIAIVDNMRKNQKERFEHLYCNHIVKLDWSRHYIFSQGPWLKTNENFYGECFIEEYRREQNHKRHKLFYLIKHTEKMKAEWDSDNCGAREGCRTLI